MTALTFIEYGDAYANVLSVDGPTTKFAPEIAKIGILVIAESFYQTRL